MTEFAVRNYRPEVETDFLAVKEMLGDMYVEAQDNRQQLGRFSTALPSSTLLCVDARDENSILGTLHLTDSFEPGLLARNYENTNFGPEVRQKVRETLFKAGFEEFRRRGHRRATLLLDYDKDVGERLAELERYGLSDPIPCSSYVRPLRAEDTLLAADVSGSKYVQIRPYNPRVDFRAFTNHLFNAGALGHMDTRTILRGYVEREPTSVVVAAKVDTDQIVGSLRIPHGPIPLIGNLTIELNFSNPEMVEAALHAFAFGALLKRGMTQIEKIGIPGLPSYERGFSEMWPLIQVTKTLVEI